jgi:hypothetical protein
MALSASTLYAGGYFTNLGGQARNYIGAVDTSTGNATSFDPDSNSTVYSLQLRGTTLYAGGGFTFIGNQNKLCVVALDTTQDANNATTFDANPNGVVNALLLSGSSLYIGGGFTNIGGNAFANFATVDGTTGAVTSTNGGIDDQVFATANNGATIFAGGMFSRAGNFSSPGLALIAQ